MSDAICPIRASASAHSPSNRFCCPAVHKARISVLISDTPVVVAVAVPTAGAEVLAPLLGQSVQHLPSVRRATYRSPFEGAGVEGPAFVPGVGSTVVGSEVYASGMGGEEATA